MHYLSKLVTFLMLFKDLRLPFDFIFFWFYIWCKFSDLYFFLTFPGFQVPLSKVLNPTMYELVTHLGVYPAVAHLQLGYAPAPSL